MSVMECPKFAGKDSQCFYMFQDKMRRALKSNRVPRIDLAAKLRENLGGHALALVPGSMRDVEDAMLALSLRYGDKERILEMRILELKKWSSGMWTWNQRSRT